LEEKRKYNGKVLLLGEYTTLLGSAALALPYPDFSGKWEIDPNKADRIATLLPKIKDLGDISFDFEQLETDLKQGIYFDSNIPEGYGVGSSGALTAALFDKYVKREPADILALKQVLGQIEGLFHGKSSGMDPLISLLNYPIIKHPDGQLELIMNEIPFEQITYELIDSGQQRETASLVNEFMNRLDADSNFNTAMQTLSTHNNRAVSQLLSQDLDGFSASLNMISQLQYDHLQFLIPKHIKAKWDMSKLEKDGIIKLCGAGGGGFFLKINM